MKTLCPLVALALLPLVSHAQRTQRQIGEPIRMDRFHEINAAGLEKDWRRRQIRLVDGVTNNLNDPGWERISGQVLQNVADGMMVRVGYTGERIFLLRAPRTADDLPIDVYAKDTGALYTYQSVGAGPKAVRKFDCGLAITAAPPVAAAEPVRVLTPEEKLAMGDRVLKFHREQAEKGLPSFQYLMGQRYLKGDGVPRDEKLARDYFDKAAKQGDTDARSALTNFPTLLGGK